MFPRPCLEAIEIYNKFFPRDWLHQLNFELRRGLLNEKEKIIRSEALNFSSINKKITQQKIIQEKKIIHRPAPQLPSFLFSPLDSCVSLQELILNYFPSKRVESILKNLVESKRYASDWIDGEWKILAPISSKQNPTFLDLMGMVHELGHVLSNGNNYRQNLHQMIVSESLAMILEERVVENFILTKEQKTEWFNYQRLVDQSNFYFFKQEFSLTTITDDHVLLNKAFIFRESLWTSHGYQLVYAASSLIRLKIQGLLL